ncbi:MAG: hydrogenase maturation protease [Bacteroidota bacterium]|nr:hydrogenase maturation protease [Bacteroidota bacterium]
MKTLVLGIGNDILSDDGIGPRLAGDLSSEFKNPEISFQTLALGGLDILDLIRDFDKVVILDAIRTENGVPGDVYLFTPSGFKGTQYLSNLHDIQFPEAIKLGRRLGIKITKNIRIIAVEISEDRIFSTEFSPQIKENYPQIRRDVLRILKKVVTRDKS